MSKHPSSLRPPAVAGAFYPEDPEVLGKLVRGFLAEAAPASPPAPARAAVAPHAGLIYSGRCAARVFARVAPPSIAVIIAPNHRGWRSVKAGASLWRAGAFRTPLGDVPVAEDFATALLEACPLVAHDPVAHQPEHAVEVELPFLQICAPDAKIVPILLMWDEWEDCRELAAALAGVIADCRDTVLLVASSDMTHFESADDARSKDELALAAIERLDGQALLEVCRRHDITMCGRAPAATVVEAARLAGAKDAKVVDYRHSGLVTGDHSSVVAYAGVVVR
jgi:MEMO1 family protein